MDYREEKRRIREKEKTAGKRIIYLLTVIILLVLFVLGGMLFKLRQKNLNQEKINNALKQNIEKMEPAEDAEE